MALELMDQLEIVVPEFGLPARVTDDPDRVASDVRLALRIGLDEQFTWHDVARGFGAWSDAIEKAGALVGQMSGIAVTEARGFSVGDRPLPIIIVNGKDRGGRVFTLIHELGHAMLRAGAICDLRERSRARSHDARVEVFCNRLAAAVLVPNESLLREAVVASSDRRYAWSMPEVSRLATKYSVSRDVILRRLLDNEKITRERYGELRAQLEAQYLKLDQRKAGGGVAPAVLAIRNSGHRFSELVVHALERDEIPRPEAARLMGVGLEHLRDVETRIASPA